MPAAPAPFDYSTSGSYGIEGPSRDWTSDRISKFDQQYQQDQKNFAHYLDRDSKGNPVSVPVYGGQRGYHVRLANGREGLMWGVPNDPFQVTFQETNVPPEQQKREIIPIRPGAEHYAEMLGTVRDTTNPRTGQPITIQPGSVGDLVSKANSLGFAEKSVSRQNEAAQVTQQWRNAMNLDHAFNTVEELVKKMGPETIKAQQAWAEKASSLTGEGALDPNHQDFLKLLKALSVVSQYGGSAGAGLDQPTVAGAIGTTVSGLGGGFFPKWQGLADGLKLIKSGDLNVYDVAANVHGARLLNLQNAVNEVGQRSHDYTLPLSEQTLQQAAKQGAKLESGLLGPKDALKSGDDSQDPNRPSIFDYEVAQHQEAGLARMFPGTSPTNQPTKATVSQPEFQALPPEQRALTMPNQSAWQYLNNPANAPMAKAAPEATPASPAVTVPALAQGGIVTRPTLALIGEAGPEKVTPMTAPMAQTQSPAMQIAQNMPTLSAQEHVNALPAGSPFRWNDGLTYVKV